MWLDLGFIAFGVILTLGTAIFVAAEFSLVALDRATVEQRASSGDQRAGRILTAMRSLSTELSGAQVGITVTTILLGYTTQNSLSSLFTKAFGSAGLAITAATTLGLIVAGILVNAFSMVFGELVPKNLALADPLRTAGLVVSLQSAFTRLLRPVISLLNGSANWVLRRLGIEPVEELSSARSASELAALIRHSADEGTLDVSTATLLTKSISFGELSAVDVMTDRGRMVTLQRDETAADVVATARETGHSRFPVVGESSDDVLGIVHLRRAVAVPYERRAQVPVTSSSLMIEAPRVPETVPLAPLLLELRAAGTQIAVVVDEYGGTSGIVTLEDVVEEIVGEVADEHDPRRREYRAVEADIWVVPGVARPDELAEHTGIVVPDDGPYETLAGLVMTELGRVPQTGDVVEKGQVRLRVERMVGRRVAQIRVCRCQVTEEPA